VDGQAGATQPGHALRMATVQSPENVAGGRQVDMARFQAWMGRVYGKITGRECIVEPFVVLRNSAIGWYTVHLWGTGELYTVRLKRLGASDERPA
jgi:hypothetical protein